MKARFWLSQFSVSQSGKLSSWTLLTHKNMAVFLQQSAEKCCSVLHIFFFFFPSLWSLRANDGAYALLSDTVIKCVWEQLSEETERWREREWFCPTLSVLRDSATCVKAWSSTACVSHINVCTVCVCVYFGVIRPTKLVYHQLCFGSHSIPASVQYFFSSSFHLMAALGCLTAPPEGGYCGQIQNAWLYVDWMFYGYGHNI